MLNQKINCKKHFRDFSPLSLVLINTMRITYILRLHKKHLLCQPFVICHLNMEHITKIKPKHPIIWGKKTSTPDSMRKKSKRREKWEKEEKKETEEKQRCKPEEGRGADRKKRGADPRSAWVWLAWIQAGHWDPRLWRFYFLIFSDGSCFGSCFLVFSLVFHMAPAGDFYGDKIPKRVNLPFWVLVLNLKFNFWGIRNEFYCVRIDFWGIRNEFLGIRINFWGWAVFFLFAGGGQSLVARGGGDGLRRHLGVGGTSSCRGND